MVFRMRLWRTQFEKSGAAGQSKGFELARGALIEDWTPVTASLVAKGAGDSAFAKAGRSVDQQVLMTRDPAAICKMGHDTSVQAVGCAQIQIIDTGILTQGCELKPGGQLLGCHVQQPRGQPAGQDALAP